MLGPGVLGRRPGGAKVGSQRHRCKGFPLWEFLSLGHPVLPAARRSSHTGASAQPSGCVCGNSPLCSPFTAGFIDFIVEPTFSVLTDVAEKSVQPLADEDSKSKSQPR